MSRFAPLRSLMDHLGAVPLSPAEHHEVIFEGLGRYLAGEEETLEAALGVRPSSSQGRSARTMAEMEERDRLLREAAAEFLPGLSGRAQAAELHRRWMRYAASGWKRGEDVLDVPPANRVGTLDGLFWAMLHARDDVLGEERIRRILGRGLVLAITHPRADLDPEG